MRVAFQDDSFAFEFIRNLGFTYYAGADLGKMFATAEQIVEGDLESWFAAWNARGSRTLKRAEAYLAGGHPVSARESFLRASTYFRMAEFYLNGNPSDPRILATAKASVSSYAQAARLMGPTWGLIEIPYDGTRLPGYFYKATRPVSRGRPSSSTAAMTRAWRNCSSSAPPLRSGVDTIASPSMFRVRDFRCASRAWSFARTGKRS